MTTRRIAQTKAAKTAKPDQGTDQPSKATTPTDVGSAESGVGDGAAMQDAVDSAVTASTVAESEPASETAEGTADIRSADDDQADLTVSHDISARGAAAGDIVDLIDVLVVTGPAKGARRAGLRFGPEPQVLPISILRQEEIDAIEGDHRLSTQREQRPASNPF
ncbi:hypothetical protein [Kaistia sp. MMO-174]|uniref:hypothetical protein n=1 Tax=Kaistia sp. MMO-174 TaxID=3081256 RepID=UPI0030190580